MKQIDPKEIRRHSSAVTQALREWEEDPSSAQVGRLRDTAAQVRQQLAEWDSAEVYPSFYIKQLKDQIAHVDARLVQARQEQERGY